MNLVYGIASALGAATGGLMAEKLGWRWEFGVQVPLLVLCFGIGIVAIPAKLGVEDGKKTVWEALSEFDLKGSTLLTLSVTFFILGLVSNAITFASAPKSAGRLTL
jgi:MFS family permease